MRCASEPFVVRHDTTRDSPDPLIRLADVLITKSTGQPRHDQLAALFGEYPGLTLVLVIGPDRTVGIGARDGAAASLQLDPSMSVELAAVFLYRSWVGQFYANGRCPW